MNIKFIFCISTGRCGTDYLKSLFNQLDNCSAYHEQKPVLHNQLMRFYLNGDKKPLQKELKYKLQRILSNPSKIYVDTTHLFIKGFGWELPKYISQNEIGVIVLKRSKEDVVHSTHRVQSGPFTYLGRKWILVPYKNYLIRPPISYSTYTLYRYILKLYWLFKGEYRSKVKSYPKFFERKSKLLLNWYYEETYALGEKYKSTFPDINYIDISLEEINTKSGFKKIIKKFKLEEHADFDAIEPFIGKARNLKNQFKSN